MAFKWDITEGQTLRGDSTYYPNFNSLPEFRWLTNVNYVIAIGMVDGLKLDLGVKDEYDSEAIGENNNLKYFGNIVYEF